MASPKYFVLFQTPLISLVILMLCKLLLSSLLYLGANQRASGRIIKGIEKSCYCPRFFNTQAYFQLLRLLCSMLPASIEIILLTHLFLLFFVLSVNLQCGEALFLKLSLLFFIHSSSDTEGSRQTKKRTKTLYFNTFEVSPSVGSSRSCQIYGNV